MNRHFRTRAVRLLFYPFTDLNFCKSSLAIPVFLFNRMLVSHILSLVHRLARTATRVSIVSCSIFASVAAGAWAQAPNLSTAAATVQIDHLVLRYGLEHPQLPSVADLQKTEVKLIHDGQTWHGNAKTSGEVMRLDAIPQGSLFDRDALRSVAEALVHGLNSRGIFGVWVTFVDLDTNGAGLVDNRSASNRSAQIVIWASQVADIRTLARGQRFSARESINNPKHRRILTHSPLKPGGSVDAPGSLFRQEVLEHYLSELSADPGRRVEASIASAGAPGKVVLDYLVTESKPWLAFAQASNTGTDATDKWRIRVGFQHNQLTNHDDALSVDIIATPDVSTYGMFLSYRIPLIRPSLLALRLYGSYGDFVASDANFQSLKFGGKNWLEGFEFSNRSSVLRVWELTSAVGLNYNHYEIQTEVSGSRISNTSAEFVTPFLSTSLSRGGEWWSVGVGLRVEDSEATNDTKTNPSGYVLDIGRAGAASKWTTLRWNVGAALYLEPLFNHGEKTPTLANEFSLRARGRVLLRGNRLIPQEEEPLGGALSVRGYPEALVSADELTLATAEYAFHVPRTFKPGERGRFLGRPFGWRPPQANQNADWDLVFRGFFDYGYRSVSPLYAASGPKPFSERSFGFSGAGVGAELLFWRNFSVRCDVGTALTEIRDNTQPAGQQIIVRSGSVRAHFVSSVSW